MKRSELFEEYVEEMEIVSDWNIHTCCYVLGSLGRDYRNGNLPEEEWHELTDKVPLSAEEKEKINF